MIHIHEDDYNREQTSQKINNDMKCSDLRIDCEKCFGFCCIALYFSASEGFPTNKDAGKPCINLQEDFRCSVHSNLRKKGLKGCTAYDCFGAGQKVAQVTYGGQSWRQAPESSKQMFEVFLIMRQLHEMLWYLSQGLTQRAARPVHDELRSMIKETEALTQMKAEAILSFDITMHRAKVNSLLQQVSELVRAKFRSGQKAPQKRPKMIAGRLDYIGADLKKANLRGADLRGAYLIASDLSRVDLSGADLIAADMRDANLSGADLAYSLNVTQQQINGAKGDENTKLPRELTRPAHW